MVTSSTAEVFPLKYRIWFFSLVCANSLCRVRLRALTINGNFGLMVIVGRFMSVHLCLYSSLFLGGSLEEQLGAADAVAVVRLLVLINLIPTLIIEI